MLDGVHAVAHAAAHPQRADALWTVELVGRHAHQVDGRGLHVEGQQAQTLGRAIESEIRAVVNQYNVLSKNDKVPAQAKLAALGRSRGVNMRFALPGERVQFPLELDAAPSSVTFEWIPLGEIASVDTARSIAGTFDAPNDLFPVPLRVDNSGNIYTSDYENGVGTLPADIFKFNSQGELIAQANDPGLFGPFGLALSGTVLAGDPPVEWTYQLAASDPDGDPLTYTLVMGPPGMVLDANTNILSWLVTSEDIGEYEVTLAVDDGQGGVTQQMFVLVVSAG